MERLKFLNKIIDIIKNPLYKNFVTNAYINCIRKCFVEIKFSHYSYRRQNKKGEICLT